MCADVCKRAASVCHEDSISPGILRAYGLCPFCADMTETSCVTAISEGGRERTQHGNCRALLSDRWRDSKPAEQRRRSGSNRESRNCRHGNGGYPYVGCGFWAVWPFQPQAIL